MHPLPRTSHVSSYDDLPELVRTNARAVVASVLPKTSDPRRFAESLTSSMAQSATHWRGRDTRIAMAPAKDLAFEGAGALLRGDDFEAFRCGLPTRWGWPIKEAHQRRPANDTDPVLRALAHLSTDHVVYAKRIADRNAYAYLVLLPWRRRKRPSRMSRRTWPWRWSIPFSPGGSYLIASFRS